MAAIAALPLPHRARRKIWRRAAHDLSDCWLGEVLRSLILQVPLWPLIMDNCFPKSLHSMGQYKSLSAHRSLTWIKKPVGRSFPLAELVVVTHVNSPRSGTYSTSSPQIAPYHCFGTSVIEVAVRLQHGEGNRWAVDSRGCQ